MGAITRECTGSVEIRNAIEVLAVAVQVIKALARRTRASLVEVEDGVMNNCHFKHRRALHV